MQNNVGFLKYISKTVPITIKKIAIHVEIIKHTFKQILKSKKFSNILNNICPPSKVILGNKLNANKHKLTTAPMRIFNLQHIKNNIKFPKQPEINTIISCKKFNSLDFVNLIPLSSKQTHLGLAEKIHKKII